MSNRDVLRGKLLGRTPKRRSEVVKVDIEGEAIEVEVRQPSVGGRAKLLQKADIKSGKPDDVDPAQLQVVALVEMCYEPGTLNRIFEPTDRDVILDQDCGGWADVLFQKCMVILNVDPQKKAQDLAGSPTGS